MATFNIFEQFSEDLAHGVHNLGTDTLKVYLTNAAPSASGDAIKADLAEISSGNGYTGGGHTPSITSSEQTAGLYKLVLADVTITASGGTIGPFRYAVLYNDTPSSPADPLIGYWDYGSAITLAIGEFVTVDMSPTNGVLQLDF